MLSQDSVVVELGCGISTLVALLVAPRIARYVLTDQAYVAKLAEQNVAENQQTTQIPNRRGASSAKTSRSKQRASPNPAARGREAAGAAASVGKIHFSPLDWETDEVTSALTGPGSEVKSFDAVVACDCIYNEALVEPFVSTCADLCRLRAAEAEAGSEPCVCVVAQHLRDPLVFEAFIERFSEVFHTWRVPDELLHPGLCSNTGFAVHVGVLKDAISISVIQSQ